MPLPPISLSCPKKLSSEYQPYACGNFFWYSSILEKIAILRPPELGLKKYGDQLEVTVGKFRGL